MEEKDGVSAECVSQLDWIRQEVAILRLIYEDGLIRIVLDKQHAKVREVA